MELLAEGRRDHSERAAVPRPHNAFQQQQLSLRRVQGLTSPAQRNAPSAGKARPAECLLVNFLSPHLSFLPLQARADGLHTTRAGLGHPHGRQKPLKVWGQNSEPQSRWPRPPLIHLKSTQYLSFAFPKYKRNKDRWLWDAATKCFLGAADEQIQSPEAAAVVFLQ